VYPGGDLYNSGDTSPYVRVHRTAFDEPNDAAFRLSGHPR